MFSLNAMSCHGSNVDTQYIVSSYSGQQVLYGCQDMVLNKDNRPLLRSRYAYVIWY